MHYVSYGWSLMEYRNYKILPIFHIISFNPNFFIADCTVSAKTSTRTKRSFFRSMILGPFVVWHLSISPYSGPTLGAFPLANLHFHGARLLYRLYCKTWLFNPTWTGVILGQVIDGRGALIHQNIGCKLKKKKLKIWHFPNEIGHFESVQCEFGGKLSRFPWF